MNNELKLRAIRVGDILDEENDITIVQVEELDPPCPLMNSDIYWRYFIEQKIICSIL